MEKHKLTLWPSGKVIEMDENTSILEAMRGKGEYLKSSCGGHATCTDCVVKVMSGESSLTPPPFEEIRLLGNVFHITKERLACQAKLKGDVAIDVSSHDQGMDEEKTRQKSSHFVKTQTVLKKKGASTGAPLEKKHESDRMGNKGSVGGYGVKGKMGGNRKPRPFKSTPDEGNE